MTEEKVRVKDITAELGVSNKDMLAALRELSIPAKSHMATLTADDIERVKDHFASASGEHDKVRRETQSGVIVRRRRREPEQTSAEISAEEIPAEEPVAEVPVAPVEKTQVAKKVAKQEEAPAPKAMAPQPEAKAAPDGKAGKAPKKPSKRFASFAVLMKKRRKSPQQQARLRLPPSPNRRLTYRKL